jgi:hypothetical protein
VVGRQIGLERVKRKLTEVIAYKLVIFVKVVYEHYHRLASWTSLSVGSG